MKLFLQKIFSSFLARIIAGIALIVASVMIAESAGSWLTDISSLPEDRVNLIVAILESALALTAYILFYRFAERRKITELQRKSFLRMAIVGFGTGLLLQALIVLTIYLSGHYTIEKINQASYLMPALYMSLSAGFVAELIIRGVVFRILEEKLGTAIALVLLMIVFAIAHAGSPGASPVSVSATSVQAGLLLSSAYIVSRSLWLPIFLHFAYDFAEPGIFGGINPGIHTDKSLFTATISGNNLLTGSEAGPQNSLQGLILCLLISAVFLYLAGKKNQFIKPYWQTEN